MDSLWDLLTVDHQEQIVMLSWLLDQADHDLPLPIHPVLEDRCVIIPDLMRVEILAGHMRARILNKAVADYMAAEHGVEGIAAGLFRRWELDDALYEARDAYYAALGAKMWGPNWEK